MTYRFLTDLAEAARTSGLRVVEVPGWQRRGRPASTGSFDPGGVLCHHTGSGWMSPARERVYAFGMLATVGRPDLGPPLCQLALGHDATVYVCAAGRANHAGVDRNTRGDGNRLRVGIEAMNNGTEGWGHVGTDALGNAVTQHDAYVRLVAALCRHYGWHVDNVRAHREQSVTGKWDPGRIDMNEFRAAVTAAIQHPHQEDDDMADAKTQAQLARIEKLVTAVAQDVIEVQDTVDHLDKVEKGRHSFTKAALAELKLAAAPADTEGAA